ncbi:MAG: malonyl-CoA decarboxylase family protein, partial [Pseudomonadota bacterium]|nr:malonyl-CoA decarboxylase family protein [Pseudomonadota bacterium]
KFLVDLRADILRYRKVSKKLSVLSDDLQKILGSWFDIALLEMRQIDWSAPAALLEKLIAYEAVHEIRSWDDLKNRLDSDRRCFAFFHPKMPDEPLIFVEVALVSGLAGNVAELLDESDPAFDPDKADCAIFYSISNAQQGLAGISFGNFLIKRVVDVLSHELPNLKTFATLSPIPGFRAWLDAQEGRPLLAPAERRALNKWVDAPAADDGADDRAL